jgi:hypothetical protein
MDISLALEIRYRQPSLDNLIGNPEYYAHGKIFVPALLA